MASLINGILARSFIYIILYIYHICLYSISLVYCFVLWTAQSYLLKLRSYTNFLNKYSITLTGVLLIHINVYIWIRSLHNLSWDAWIHFMKAWSSTKLPCGPSKIFGICTWIFIVKSHQDTWWTKLSCQALDYLWHFYTYVPQSSLIMSEAS